MDASIPKAPRECSTTILCQACREKRHETMRKIADHEKPREVDNIRIRSGARQKIRPETNRLPLKAGRILM